MNSRLTRFRIILAILAPLMLSAVASSWLINRFSVNQLERQGTHFGQAIADQMANTSTYYLVSNDVLSLNVMLDELLARHNFDFAAVYSPDGQLLAQSGKHTNSQQTFTREINFQDTDLGHVLIELDAGLLQQTKQRVWIALLVIHGLIVLLTVCVVWFYSDLGYLWVTRRTHRRDAALLQGDSAHHIESPTDRCTLLVVKIRPSRLVPLDGIIEACRIYEGQLETASDEEWLITFNSGNQLSRSLCCGLFIKEIALRQTGKLHFKAGIDSALADDLTMLRKQASYLASVSNQSLVVSERVNAAIQGDATEFIADEIESRPFHSSLTGDGEVYVVEGPDLVQRARGVVGG